ncbi:hypothetical protein [Marinoscillum sp.]|uniref:hypothetical protein n=1 Tax=Marinoscillum sp. TaxID=2024838 RepID=UPI003BADA43B
MQRITLIALLLAVQLAYAQNPDFVQFKPFHFGVVPGFGSTGVYGLKYEHNVSINLFSGHAYANNILSIAGISHFQVQRSQGINIAGISNILGAYPFLKVRQHRDSLAEFGAIQVAGLINGVNGGGFGGQLSGGINLVTGTLDGIQISSIHNDVNKALSGGQISLVSNRVGDMALGFQSALVVNRARMMSGTQLFALFNYVNHELDGLQFGGFNAVSNRNSHIYRENRFYWMQLGLFNLAFENGDGYQVGLVNYGKDIGFAQLGLINISDKIPQYPVGLLNLAGDINGFLRAHTNRMFRYNIEMATGSKKLLSALTYSWDGQRDRNGYSYALGNQKKKGPAGLAQNQYFYEAFLQVTNLVENGDSFLDPNLIYTAKAQFGYNPFRKTKMMDLYFFVGLTGNATWIDSGDPSVVEGPLVSQTNNHTFWADLNFGVQL